jgi:hypothetical protein
MALRASEPFVIAYGNSSPRNDFSGFVGMSLTVGGNDLSVTALGRVCLSGNVNTHVVKLVNASNGSDVAGGSASVSMAGCSAGQFVYGNLSNAVTLSSSTTYYVVSQETASGDTWYDLFGSMTVTGDAHVNGPLYSYNGAWIQNGVGTLSYVPVNFQYSVTSGGGGGGNTPPTGSGALLASYSATAANVRNDYSGWAGMAFTVNPSTAMVANALGRICLSGNNGSHVVKLVNASTGQDVPASAVSVSMGGCTPGQFAYANLPNAIQLTPATTYYLVSQEMAGGDTWYDARAVTANSATVNGSVYSWNGAWQRNGDGSASYVPPNLQFALAGSANTPPTIGITSPTSGATISGTYTLSVTAQASSPATIQSVTYYLDGASLGAGSAAQGFGFNWDTTTTSDGSHSLTALAQDSAGLTTMSSSVSFAVNNGTGGGSGGGGGASGGGTPFITTYGFFNPHLRNDFDSFAGTQLVLTGSTPLTVTYVGRGCVAGNSQSHTVKFVYAKNGVDVPGGAASVNMAGCTPGQFAWAALPAPITLQPGVNYYLVSLEYINGDLWYEKAPVTTQSFATIISAIYLQDNGAWHQLAPPNYSYVPPNFK